MQPTRSLANYVAQAPYADLPPEVVHEAKRSLLNWLGVAIGASRHATVSAALEAVRPVSGASVTTLLGRAERLDPLHGAFVNGLASHVFDFDDTHLRTIIHPSGPVAPVVLALSETRRLSGRELLHAFVLGVEIECRVGNAVYPSHYDVGWHITGTAGVFGAAAAASRILELDPDRLAQALGIAASQASGFREMFGTMTKPFHVGNAAKNGLFAAMLAQNGFTSSFQAIEAPRGFAHVAATERDLGELTTNLGRSYEITRNAYKPFACGIVIHPAIDGCVRLREAHAPAPQKVERVEIRAHPLVLELTGKRTPSVGLEGKFSVFHSAAVALIDGKAGEAQYSDARVLSPEVVALRDRVEVTTDPSIRTDEAHVRIHLDDGRVLEVHVEHAIGSLEHPMTDRDLEEKFHDLVAPILPQEAAKRLIALCWDLDELDDAAELARVAALPAEAPVGTMPATDA